MLSKNPLTSGGTIPDNADYQVLLEPESQVIGTVNEDFAQLKAPRATLWITAERLPQFKALWPTVRSTPITLLERRHTQLWASLPAAADLRR